MPAATLLGLPLKRAQIQPEDSADAEDFTPTLSSVQEYLEPDEALLMCHMAVCAYLGENDRGTFDSACYDEHFKNGLLAEGGVRETLELPMLQNRLVRFADDKYYDTQAFVSERLFEDGTATVTTCCRGTTGITDWLTNITAHQTYFEPLDDEDDAGCCARCDCFRRCFCCKCRAAMVHLGFYQAFLPLRKMIDEEVLPRALGLDGKPPCRSVRFCGHSLGGALATLCYAYFLLCVAGRGMQTMVKNRTQLVLTTMGQPRVGNRHFVKLLEDVSKPLKAAKLLRVVRLVHHGDIVTSVPWVLLGFCHYGDAMLFQKLSDGSHRLLLGNFRDGTDKEWLRKASTSPVPFSSDSQASETKPLSEAASKPTVVSTAPATEKSRDSKEAARLEKKLQTAIKKEKLVVVKSSTWSHSRLLEGIQDHDCIGYHKCAVETKEKCNTADLSSLIVTAPSVWKSMLDSAMDAVGTFGEDVVGAVEHFGQDASVMVNGAGAVVEDVVGGVQMAVDVVGGGFVGGAERGMEKAGDGWNKMTRQNSK